MYTTHLSAPAEIADVARDIRRRAGQHEPKFSTRTIIEACFPEVLVSGARLPSGVDELVSRRRDGIVIAYSRSLSGPEQRFAIAHGLAHVLFDLDTPDVNIAPGRIGDPAVECRADCFAAELLAPLDVLAPFIYRWPSPDEVENEIYLDMVDEIASQFVLPAEVIDLQIRAFALSQKFGTLTNVFVVRI